MKNRIKNIKQLWKNSILYCDYTRIWRLIMYYGISGIKYLLPWHFYLDYVEISITTKCNLRCPDCANLMPLYNKPYDIDTDIIIRSIKKICECFDVCGQIRILGGEPFLHPELKRIIAEIPVDKCKKISIPTNATIVPEDRELYKLLREKNVVIALGNYPSALDSQQELVKRLKAEGVRYEFPKSNTWIDYGEVINYNRQKKELAKQFTRCNLRSKSLLNGVVYYCPRYAHGSDIGVIKQTDSECVNILDNTNKQNRRELRKLMWRHTPVEACKYCLRGTNMAIDVNRGK